MDNLTMSKKELLVLISNALHNAGTFYSQGRVKHFLTYYGRAFALIDLYECQFNSIEEDDEDINFIFEHLSTIYDGIRI